MARLVRTLGAAVLVLALLAGVAPSTAGASTASEESHFVALINDLRARNGLGALQVHPHLVSVARSWAGTMAGAGDIWHNPNLASDVSAGEDDWRKLGENVGVGPNVEVLHQAFVDSPGHYRNLVDPEFNYIGVGVVMGADGSMYTAHQFMTLAEAAAAAAPVPTPPVTEAAQPAPREQASTTAPVPVPDATAPPTAPSPEAAPVAASAGVSSLPAVLESLRVLEHAG